MPISVNLQDMFSYSLLLTIGLGLLVVIPIVILLIVKLKGYKLPKRKKKAKPVQPKPVSKRTSDQIRAYYLKMINEIEKKYNNKEIDDREAYLQLSSAVRGFVQERTGVRAMNLTLHEISGLGMPSLHNLIAEFYRPEFSFESENANTPKSITDARTVVEKWN